MPPTRKSKKEESVDEKSDKNEAVVKKTKFIPKEPSQWMFIMNDEAIKHDPNNENRPMICPLRHPKTDGRAQFLFANEDRDVYEVTQFKEEFQSWFIGETVQHDGSLYITTAVDSVFLVLPYLIQAEKTGKYITLDQMLADDSYPECQRLQNTCGLSELYQVADVKGDEDFKAYKYNKDKTLSWLKLKTERVSSVLERKNVCVSGARSAEYIKSCKASTNKDEYLRYAFGLVSDYLPLELGSTLREHLGIPVVAEKRPTDSNNPPSKRVKLEDITPTEDYSKNIKPEVKSKGKATIAQKKLDKVDKSGMKSMMSFFSPKSAKS